MNSLSLELVGLFIDNLADDIESLRHCSLVSRSWRRRSQHNLLASVHVEQARIENLEKCIKGNPHLRGAVRRLRYGGDRQSISDPSARFSVFLDLIQMFPNIFELKLVGLSVCPPHFLSLTYPDSPITTIQSLFLIRCKFDTRATVQNLLYHCFPSLAKLVVNRCICLDDQTKLPHRHWPLKSATVLSCGRPEELLLQAACVCNLDEMVFHSGNFYYDSSVLETTFKRTEGELKHLTLSSNLRGHSEWIRTIRYPTIEDLYPSLLLDLRTLVVRNINFQSAPNDLPLVPHPRFMLWFADLPAAIPSLDLETIEIHTATRDHERFLHFVDWPRVATVLRQLAARKHARPVRMNIFVLIRYHTNPQSVLTLIENGLAQYIEEGLVFIHRTTPRAPALRDQRRNLILPI